MEELHWLNIEIIVVDDEGEEKTSLCTCSKLIIPRKGELVWMPYNWERKKEFGGRAFIVDDVAHHIAPEIKGTYDNIVVYVKLLK